MLKSIRKMPNMAVAHVQVYRTQELGFFLNCLFSLCCCLLAWWNDFPGEINKNSIKLTVENQFAFLHWILSSVLGPAVLLPKFLNRHVFLRILLHDLGSKHKSKIWESVWKYYWILRRLHHVFRTTTYKENSKEARTCTWIVHTFVTAISKSSCVTWTLLSLNAYMPASVQTP